MKNLKNAADEYAEKIKINADGNYGTAVKGMWQKLGQCTESGRKVYMIKSESFLEQLILFIACNKNGDVPMIVQKDMTQLPEINEIPDEVCMAVMTSGRQACQRYFTEHMRAGLISFLYKMRYSGLEKTAECLCREVLLLRAI